MPAVNGLTPKQELFVKEYIVDFNATRAAITAGYSEKTAAKIGSENLQKPEIQAAIEAQKKKMTKKVEVTAEFILTELLKIAGADLKNYVEYDANGQVKLKPYEEIDGRILQEISETKTQHGGTRKVKLHDKMKALELLGKYKGLFKDVVITPSAPEKLSLDEIESLDEEE